MVSPFLQSLPGGFRTDPQFGVVYDETPQSADDLTIIRGIETREAAGLNRLGIYFCGQIANWTDCEVVSVADALGMSASGILRNCWIGQARDVVHCTIPGLSGVSSVRYAPYETTPAFPASVSRTMVLLVCALLSGWLFVSWLNYQNSPMIGVLAAEITSLRVPSDSQLATVHVTAGDKVFTGETLLTLEKSKHLEYIIRQSHRVKQLAEELHKAEAQAVLELEWRSQHLDGELLDVKRRAQFLQTLGRPNEDQASGVTSADDSTFSGQFKTVFVRRDKLPFGQNRVNSLIFMNGTSGTMTVDALSTPSLSPTPFKVPESNRIIDLQGELLQLEGQNIKARMQRLEQLRACLPAQVRRATGVELLRSEHSVAQGRLAHMESLSRESAVLCPSYGIVSQVRYQEGDRMPHSEVMLKIMHPDRLYVVVRAPTERIDRLEPGSPLEIVFPGHNKYQGVVANLPMVTDTQLASGDDMTSFRIESFGRLWPELPIGSRVEVLTQ